ncbi:MAG: polysaccharide deacetylase family protein, partial [Pseudomonadota bacterium]
METARLSGLPRLLTRSFGGVGAIIAMHRVRAPSDEPFQPNRTLEVTPSFLDRTLAHLRARDIDIVHLDEVERRLREQDFGRRFVCFTLDDGYADNYLEAFPVFKAHDAPFSIYLTSGFVDHTCLFWWMILEEVIRRQDEVTLQFQGRSETLKTRTLEEKEQAFDVWHGHFRAFAADDVEAVARDFCDDYGIDPGAFCAEHAMTWDMARDITEDGLGRIEAHTVSHVALSLLRPEDIEGD